MKFSFGRKAAMAAPERDPSGFDAFEVSLGDAMRGERATLGKSLLDVQRELKIKATYIAAIENADPSAFETPGFIAGYVRSYARYLGMDPEWAFGKFCEESGFETAHGMSKAASFRQRSTAPIVMAPERDIFAEPNAPFTPKADALFSRVEPGAIGSVAVLVALIGAVGWGGWTVLQEVQRVQVAPVDGAPGLVSDIDPLNGSGTITVAETETGSTFETPAPEALDRLYRPRALDVPVLVARDGPIASIDPSDNTALEALPEEPAVAAVDPDSGIEVRQPTAADAAVLAALGQVPEEEGASEVPEDTVQVFDAAQGEVVLVAVRPTWVRVRSADRSVILEKVMETGETFVLPATEEPPLLRTGNAGALYFAVAGQTYGPAGPGPSVVNNVPLSPEALTANYAVADIEADADLARIVRVAEAEGGE